MKKRMTGAVTLGAVALYALPANAALVQTIIELQNSTPEKLVIPAIPPARMGGGAFVDPRWPGCHSGTLDGATQTITLQPGECGAWETRSTGGTSGTSASVAFPIGGGGSMNADIATIHWNYPWDCGPDNYIPWFLGGSGACNPSADSQVDAPQGNVFQSCPVGDFHLDIQTSVGGETNIDGQSIDSATFTYQVTEPTGTTCGALDYGPTTPTPPVSAPQNCQWSPGCDGALTVTCDALQYEMTFLMQDAAGQWLTEYTLLPPYMESTVSLSGGGFSPGETAPWVACYMNDGIPACTSPVTLVAPQCSTGSSGGGGGGGSGSSGGSGGGGHKPVLQ